VRRRPRTRARQVGGLVAALVLLASGCGRDAEASYGERVTAVVQGHAAAIERHQSTARAAAASDPAGAAAELHLLAAELEALADDVDALEAPADREAATGRLVEAYRLLARAALELRTALISRDGEAARTAQTDYAAAAAREREAAAALGAD